MFTLLFRSLVCIAAFLLSGCGFHLSNNESLPPQLRTLYFQSDKPYDQFTVALKNTLTANGINIVSKPNAAKYSFTLTGISLTHSGASIYSSAQANIYSFTFTANFQLDAEGKAILSSRGVSASRNLTLNPNEILESSNQVDSLVQEMQQEVIIKILNILKSPQTLEALH